MGSGVSKLPGRHSDSRVDEVRAELVKGANAAASGNSTFTLKLSLQEFASALGGADQKQPKKTRTLSLPGSSGSGGAAGGVWGKRGPSTSPIHSIGSLDEIHDEADAAQLVLPDREAPSLQETRRSAGATDDDSYSSSSDEFYEDDFEDEISEWKRGDSIGSGSYGTVYLARDERTGGLMAVKEILIADENDADISSAMKEVELLRSLRDDHVIKYLGSSIDNDAKKLFIFTEWVPGGNLEQNRKKFGGNETIVRRFTQQILRGVAYLHSKNIVHHDIKPSNILVDQHGVVKLADFGASRLISSSTSVNNESMRGTPNYMAPEVIKQTTRSRKSDIWSVGCSVLRLLTGQPFWGDKKFDSQISLLYYIAHLEALPPLPPELSDDARSFVAACLEIDPVLRPSALELLQHSFVKAFEPRGLASRSARSPSTRVQSAPVDKVHRSLAPLESVPRPAPATRALSSAPSQFNLPRLRTGAAARQDAHAALPVLPNAFGLPEEEADVPDTLDSGEASIPSFSTTVFPLDQSTSAPSSSASQQTGGTAKATTTTHKSSHLVMSGKQQLTSLSSAPPTAIGTSERAVDRAPLQGLVTVKSVKWEEQPIETDAARVEREQRLATLEAQKRKREERERRFQDELAEFRRQMGHH